MCCTSPQGILADRPLQGIRQQITLINQFTYFVNIVALQTVNRTVVGFRVKASGFFTEIINADKTEAHKRGLLRQGYCTPPSSSSVFLSLSLCVMEWGTCHWLFLVPDLLSSMGSDHIWHSWDVYALGWSGGGQQPKYLEYRILNPHAAWHQRLSHGNREVVLM